MSGCVPARLSGEWGPLLVAHLMRSSVEAVNGLVGLRPAVVGRHDVAVGGSGPGDVGKYRGPD
jgi:hypothetical protein